MFQMILTYVVGFGIEHMCILFGPLSTTLCRLGCFIRVFSGSNVLVLSLIIMGTRFMFVCIFRSIPMIDEVFLSRTINIIVNVLTFLGTLAKFYIEDRPNVAEVRNLKFCISTNNFFPGVVFTHECCT
jgi:hypothetical protein